MATALLMSGRQDNSKEYWNLVIEGASPSIVRSHEIMQSYHFAQLTLREYTKAARVVREYITLCPGGVTEWRRQV
ncbi:MAG: hypothetical protein FGM24_05560 [Candidatus Kapabacteria bacterium]|nr:hypothetical protein [Candidatus Kapabacteria bacterium]